MNITSIKALLHVIHSTYLRFLSANSPWVFTMNFKTIHFKLNNGSDAMVVVPEDKVDKVLKKLGEKTTCWAENAYV